MSIADSLVRIKNNITDSYSAVSLKGGELPSVKNTNNLPGAIGSIITGKSHRIF